MLVLEIISLIAILVMITVTVINIMYTVSLRRKMDEKNDNQDSEILKIKGDLASTQSDMVTFKKNLRAYLENRVEFGTRNYFERTEFNNLDNSVKDSYKKYIVDMLMPALIDKINTEVKGTNMAQYDSIISTTINNTLKQLK